MHALVRKELTNKQISEQLIRQGYGPASSAALSAWKKRHGYPLRAKSAERTSLIPWQIAVKDARHRFYNCLALASREREGQTLLDKDHNRLVKFVRELKEASAVVHYDRANGWVAVPRRPGIDNDLIRDPRIDDSGNPIAFDQKA